MKELYFGESDAYGFIDETFPILETDRESAVLESKLYDISKSAVERFGKDPKVFIDRLEYLRKNRIKDIIPYLVSNDTKSIKHKFERRNIDFEDRFIFQAIRQVSLEVPGFIDSFKSIIPEHLLFKSFYWDYDHYCYGLSEKINSFIDQYDRYTKKKDFPRLIKDLDIKDEDLTVQEDRYSKHKLRVDDYIAKNLVDILATKTLDEKTRDYLVKNFSDGGDFLPKTYFNTLRHLGFFKKKDIKKDKLPKDPDSLGVIDYYFNVIDEFVKELDIEKVAPPVMKFVNYSILIGRRK